MLPHRREVHRRRASRPRRVRQASFGPLRFRESQGQADPRDPRVAPAHAVEVARDAPRAQGGGLRHPRRVDDPHRRRPKARRRGWHGGGRRPPGEGRGPPPHRLVQGPRPRHGRLHG